MDELSGLQLKSKASNIDKAFKADYIGIANPLLFLGSKWPFNSNDGQFQ